MRLDSANVLICSGWIKQQKAVAPTLNVEALGRAIYQTANDVKVANEVGIAAKRSSTDASGVRGLGSRLSVDTTYVDSASRQIFGRGGGSTENH